MTEWKGWMVVNGKGNPMGNLLSDGPLLFYYRDAAANFARALDEESLSSDGHKPVEVVVRTADQGSAP